MQLMLEEDDLYRGSACMYTWRWTIRRRLQLVLPASWSAVRTAQLSSWRPSWENTAGKRFKCISMTKPKLKCEEVVCMHDSCANCIAPENWMQLEDSVHVKVLERIAMDNLGPFAVTERGSRYILVVGDYFTMQVPMRTWKHMQTVWLNSCLHLSMSLMSCCPISNPNPKQKQHKLIQGNWNTCCANSRENKNKEIEINVVLVQEKTRKKISIHKEHQF